MFIGLCSFEIVVLLEFDLFFEGEWVDSIIDIELECEFVFKFIFVLIFESENDVVCTVDVGKDWEVLELIWSVTEPKDWVEEESGRGGTGEEDDEEEECDKVKVKKDSGGGGSITDIIFEEFPTNKWLGGWFK